MKTNVSTRIILDTRRNLSNGFYPVKLRVTYQRKSKYYRLNYALSKKEFPLVMNPNSRGKRRSIQLKLSETEKKAIQIIEKMDEFKFADFERHFLEKPIGNPNVYSSIEKEVIILKEQGRIQTAQTFEYLKRSLRIFYGRQTLNFDKITVAFLESYENWMLGRNRSVTTIGIYLRNLRTLFNQAINKGIVSRDDYPFGRGRYQIPNGKNVKKALTKEDVRKIINYTPKSEREYYCRDLWLFSYFANGVNLADIAHMTWENVQGDFLVFTRRKTIRTNRQNPRIIRVYLNDKLKEIISRWGSPEEKATYIFPILNPGMTAEKQVERIAGIIKSINTHMRNVASQLGIHKKVTTYTARHTFSTVLKRSGASIEFISESLGHKNINTTEHYLDSFDDTEKEKWSKVLF